MFKIIQLSDCHVSADPEAVYRGLNPRAELERLLPVVQERQPDLVLLTGDLAEDASEEAYQYLKRQMDTLGVPVMTIPGNHDDAQVQKSVFDDTATDDILVHEASGWQLILLNTAVPGRIEGELSPVVLNRLEKQIKNNPVPGMVFMHHQPVLVGSPWIDRYALKEPERFWASLGKIGAIRAVLWGHVHQEFSSQHQEIALLGAPSTAVNSVPAQQRFTHDGNGPACRFLRLRENGEFETEILGAQGQAEHQQG